MKNLRIFFILFCFNIGFSQEPNKHENEGLSETEFAQAIENYKKMCSSDLYINYRANTLRFISKLGDVMAKDIRKELANLELWKQWIKQNLYRTKFINEEEAISMLKLSLDQTNELRRVNAAVYEQLQRATKEQRKEILKPDKLTNSEVQNR